MLLSDSFSQLKKPAKYKIQAESSVTKVFIPPEILALPFGLFSRAFRQSAAVCWRTAALSLALYTLN